ncbi:unannotated protein [freshwater metagenome]|uniref:Unannotated protein n=1 Tax=freshwater metagenome TaxID=449393 RepID=A0A6J7LSS6_9ZZZZ
MLVVRVNRSGVRVQLVQLSNIGCLGVEGPEQIANLAISAPKDEIDAYYPRSSWALLAGLPDLDFFFIGGLDPDLPALAPN